jgi:hypothetical protein
VVEFKCCKHVLGPQNETYTVLHVKAKPVEKIINISLPFRTKREQNMITLIYNSMPNREIPTGRSSIALVVFQETKAKSSSCVAQTNTRIKIVSEFTENT